MISQITLKPAQKLLVVGPIYDHLPKLLQMKNMFSQYDWIIFNSGLCFPNNDLSEIKKRIEIMDQYLTTGKVIYNAGRSDYLFLTHLSVSETFLQQWIRSRPNVVLAEYHSRSIFIIDGGIPEKIIGRTELGDNLEVSFVSNIKNKPWHQSYNGRLGYVISNNPLTLEQPQYYNYSMQLGNQYEAGHIYAQEVWERGLKRTILL